MKRFKNGILKWKKSLLPSNVCDWKGSAIYEVYKITLEVH